MGSCRNRRCSHRSRLDEAGRRGGRVPGNLGKLAPEFRIAESRRCSVPIVWRGELHTHRIVCRGNRAAVLWRGAKSGRQRRRWTCQQRAVLACARVGGRRADGAWVRARTRADGARGAGGADLGGRAGDCRGLARSGDCGGCGGPCGMSGGAGAWVPVGDSALAEVADWAIAPLAGASAAGGRGERGWQRWRRLGRCRGGVDGGWARGCTGPRGGRAALSALRLPWTRAGLRIHRGRA